MLDHKSDRLAGLNKNITALAIFLIRYLYYAIAWLLSGREYLVSIKNLGDRPTRPYLLYYKERFYELVKAETCLYRKLQVFDSGCQLFFIKLNKAAILSVQ